MQKQELLNKVSNYLSLINSLFEENKNELVYEEIGKLITLLKEIIDDITNNSISNTLYERISKLIDTLNISNLQRLKLIHGNYQVDKEYRQLCDNLLIECVFVGKTYSLLKAIGFANTNVVLIGANGSGKTTFANSIRKELERTDNGIVLSAQKLLIFPTYSFVPTFQSAYKAYELREKDILDDKQTFDTSKSDDIPYDLTKKYGAEMRILVSTLLGERFARRNKYCSTIKDGDTVDTNDFSCNLDEVIRIWNYLIEHRELFCDDSGNLQIRYKAITYPAYKMSDGEREIFYVVGRVLLAKESSLIVIDEPELHLHKAILNKLWDILEKKREDCMFIYLTHDIDFASTRIAKKCWLKAYSEEIKETWELEPINDDNDIPEALLMKLLGSRKRILFCEGKKKSLDYRIFEILFHDYTITPLASCKDVINYTKAFNKISNRYAEAFGIIDRDFREDEQLDNLKTYNIFSYDVAEIENLFLMEDFIKEFAKYKKEKCDICKIKNSILDMFRNNIHQQVAFFVSQKIDYYFKSTNIKRGKNKEEVRKMYSAFMNEIKIEDWFDERMKEIQEVIDNNNYEKAILLYNNKGLHSVIEQSFGITNYNNKALEFLKDSDDAKKILLKVFPSEIQ